MIFKLAALNPRCVDLMKFTFLNYVFLYMPTSMVVYFVLKLFIEYFGISSSPFLYVRHNNYVRKYSHQCKNYATWVQEWCKAWAVRRDVTDPGVRPLFTKATDKNVQKKEIYTYVCEIWRMHKSAHWNQINVVNLVNKDSRDCIHFDFI